MKSKAEHIENVKRLDAIFFAAGLAASVAWRRYCSAEFALSSCLSRGADPYRAQQELRDSEPVYREAVKVAAAARTEWISAQNAFRKEHLGKP